MRRSVRGLALLLVPFAALLAGCFTIENSFVVNEDGSGTQTVRFSLPAEFIQMMGEEAPSLADLESDPEMQALRDAIGDRGSVEFFSSEQDGFGFSMTVNVPASDDFTGALASVIEDLELENANDIPLDIVESSQPSIVRDGNTWTFQMEQPALTEEDLSSLTGGDAETAGMAGVFLSQSTITVRVKLPGEVTEQNADSVEEDGTLVWTQTGTDTARTLTATSTVGSDSSLLRILLIVAGIVVAAAVVAAIAYLAVKRRQGPPAPPPPTEPAPTA